MKEKKHQQESEGHTEVLGELSEENISTPSITLEYEGKYASQIKWDIPALIRLAKSFGIESPVRITNSKKKNVDRDTLDQTGRFSEDENKTESSNLLTESNDNLSATTSPLLSEAMVSQHGKDHFTILIYDQEIEQQILSLARVDKVGDFIDILNNQVVMRLIEIGEEETITKLKTVLKVFYEMLLISLPYLLLSITNEKFQKLQPELEQALSFYYVALYVSTGLLLALISTASLSAAVQRTLTELDQLQQDFTFQDWSLINRVKEEVNRFRAQRTSIVLAKLKN